jgi:beta-lactamase regulating signal transducer with metallopeptidase domain
MSAELLTPDPKALIEMVVAVSILIGLVLVGRKPVARRFGAGIAYALWLVPLARMVMPPLSGPVSWMSVLGLAPTTAMSTAAEAAAPAPAAHAGMAFVTHPGEAAGTVVNVIRSSTFDTEVAAPAASVLGGPDLAAMIVPGLLAIWVIGAACMILRNVWAQASFMAVVDREKSPVSPRLQALAEDVARQVGVKGKLRVATSLISTGPLVTGLLRPVVLLPAWFEDDYDRAQQRAALAHELTHIRRGDLWALQVAELFVACLWFNPLAHVGRRAFRTDQEAACDSDVLRSGAASPHEYGATLLKAVRLSFPERLPSAASLPLTHSLKERMRLLAYPVPTRARRLAGLGLTALLGSAALVTTASVTANADERLDGQPVRLKIENATLYIDGAEVKDRQFVVLGEPFNHPDPMANDEIRHLSEKISMETRKFVVPPPMPPLPPMPEMPAMPATPHVPAGVHGTHLDGGDGSDEQHVFIYRSEDMSDANEAEWDAWAQAYEARMTEWEKVVDQRVAAWEEQYGDESDAANAELEARIDGLTQDLEMRVDAAYGNSFESRMDDVAASLQTLAVSCRDANLAKGEARIMNQAVAGGEALSVVCVQGDATRLSAPETLAVIEGSDQLCDEEKKAFGKTKSSRRVIEITK